MPDKKSFFKTNPLFKVLLREIERMSKSSVYLFTTLVGPLFAFVVLLAIFSDGIPSNLPIGIVDMDNTVLSRKMSQWVDATSETEIVFRSPNLNEAQHELMTGKIQGIVLIPEGTEKEILKGSGQIVPVYINNTNILIGGYLQKGIYKALATLSSGIKLQIEMKKGRSLEQAMANIYPINTHQHVLFNPFGNYAYFLLSALFPLLIVLFTMLSTIYATGIELREGTGPNWLDHADGSIIVALVGKLIPYTLLLSINMIVMNMILFVQMGTPLHGNFFLIMFAEVVLILAYQMLGVFIVAITANLRLSLSLATAYSMMALTFAGLTFPRFSMPLLAKVFSLLFPFTYWVRIFISQAFRSEPILNGILPIGAMVLFILASVASLPRLKRLLSNEKYWGKI
ncbi:MAG: ABC transporter permease [Syntrophomonas sp.]